MNQSHWDKSGWNEESAREPQPRSNMGRGRGRGRARKIQQGSSTLKDSPSVGRMYSNQVGSGLYSDRSDANIPPPFESSASREHTRVHSEKQERDRPDKARPRRAPMQMYVPRARRLQENTDTTPGGSRKSAENPPEYQSELTPHRTLHMDRVSDRSQTSSLSGTQKNSFIENERYTDRVKKHSKDRDHHSGRKRDDHGYNEHEDTVQLSQGTWEEEEMCYDKGEVYPDEKSNRPVLCGVPVDNGRKSEKNHDRHLVIDDYERSRKPGSIVIEGEQESRSHKHRRHKKHRSKDRDDRECASVDAGEEQSHRKHQHKQKKHKGDDSGTTGENNQELKHAECNRARSQQNVQQVNISAVMDSRNQVEECKESCATGREDSVYMEENTVGAGSHGFQQVSFGPLNQESNIESDEEEPFFDCDSFQEVDQPHCNQHQQEVDEATVGPVLSDTSVSMAPGELANQVPKQLVCSTMDTFQFQSEVLSLKDKNNSIQDGHEYDELSTNNDHTVGEHNCANVDVGEKMNNSSLKHEVNESIKPIGGNNSGVATYSSIEDVGKCTVNNSNLEINEDKDNSEDRTPQTEMEEGQIHLKNEVEQVEYSETALAKEEPFSSSQENIAGECKLDEVTEFSLSEKLAQTSNAFNNEMPQDMDTSENVSNGPNQEILYLDSEGFSQGNDATHESKLAAPKVEEHNTLVHNNNRTEADIQASQVNDAFSDSNEEVKVTAIEHDPGCVAIVTDQAMSQNAGTVSLGTADVEENSPGEEEEDSWDKMFDDDGEALDPKLLEELTVAVGKVKVTKPQFDYLDYQPKDPDMDYDAYSHLIEIYDFPTELQTRDLVMAFSEFKDKGFDIKWVDDNHAIGVFSSTIAANSALSLKHPLMKVRPISAASRQTKLKAKRTTEFLQPYKPRPETVASVARNLVAGALGLRSNIPKEKRDEERRKLKEARELKRNSKKQKEQAWDGSFGKCAMDEV